MRRLAALLLLAAAIGCGRERSQQPAPPAAGPKSPATATAAGASAGTDVGNVMPAYSAKLLDGRPFDLATEKNNVVFLNVWATWCGPCRYEIPELQALHQKYSARGFKVIGVSVDEGGPDAVAQFVKDNKITYPIALDSEGRIANVLSTTVLPTSVIIGRDGKIVWRKIGAMMPNETPSVEAVVEQALGRT